MHVSMLALLILMIASQDPPSTPPDDDAPPAQGTTSQAPPPGADTVVRIDPILVTARMWEELSQNVPQALSVADGRMLRDAGIVKMSDAAVFVPNLHFTEFSARRLSFPTIRGIGATIGDPSVTTYIDGVPQLAGSSTNIALLDVERIEFLRGPQGTLYGRNSLGGLMALHTRRPGNEFAVRSQITFGNYDLFDASLSVSGPVVEDKLFFSLSGLRSSRDGYTTNDFTGNDVDFRKSFFGRGQLLWTPDERNDIRVTLYGEHARDGGFVLSELNALRDRPHRIMQDFEGRAERDILASSLSWNHYGESVDITTITGWQDWDILETSDFDFSPFDAVRRRTTESQHSLYQEVRLASPADRSIELGDRAALKWLVGGQVFSAESDRSAANDFRPGGAGIFFPPEQVGVDTSRGDFNDLGFAVFGQVTLTLFEHLDLTAGARYDVEDKEARIRRTFEVFGFPVFDSTTRLDRRDDEFLPKFSAAYRFNDDFMVYGLVAKGFKAGGFNLTAPADAFTFGPETSWTYEVGFKSTWFDDRLLFNAAVFYIDWDDMQLSLFDPFAGGYVDNAGEATSKGFELELIARVAQGLELFATFGYTDAEFREYVDPFGADTRGNQLAFVPETTFSVGAQYTHDLGRGWNAFVRGEYVHVGSYFYDAGNREGERYGLANFRIGVGGPHVRIEAWIRNAFDEEYVLVAFQPNPADPNVFVGESGAPRTYGVSVSIDF